MGNTIQTLSAGDITRKALAILHNNLVFVKTINKEYDSRFANNGAKNGGTLLIRNPNEFTIRTGQTMDTQDVTETSQTLTLATQMGVDINFSSAELTLSLDDFAERILKPAMSRLATEVDKTVIEACYPAVWNHTFTTLATAPDLADVLVARAKLAKGLAPSSDRFLMCDALAANHILTDSAAYHNPASAISKQYDQGLIGELYGFKFYESETVPLHTCGTRADVTPTVNISSTSTSIEHGIAYIAMTANAANATYKKGDVFTVAGLYAVNPETKARYRHLQQWTVTSNCTSTADLYEIPVAPTVYLSGPRQNCVVLTASATTAALVVNTSAGGTGLASTGYPQNLAYHKDAFTFVSADLELPKGVHFAAREVFDGISLRIVRQYDVVNDKFPCRIDVLFGQLATRPEWACRMAG